MWGGVLSISFRKSHPKQVLTLLEATHKSGTVLLVTKLNAHIQIKRVSAEALLPTNDLFVG